MCSNHISRKSNILKGILIVCQEKFIHNKWGICPESKRYSSKSKRSGDFRANMTDERSKL
jgi:hypothetical protein